MCNIRTKEPLCCEADNSEHFSAWRTSPELLVKYSHNATQFLKGARYWNDRSGQKLFIEIVFLCIIDGLEALDYLEDRNAKQDPLGTTFRMRASQKLIDVINKQGVNWSTIDASPDP